MEWIKTEDKPLISYDENRRWTINEGVPDEFLAAVWYHNSLTKTDNWWIRHCIIQDETGLCVVTDEDCEPAGWSISDVMYYQPLPPPPQTNNNG